MDCGADVYDSAGDARVAGGGGEEIGEGGFEGIVGAENVDVDDRFEGVGGELGDGG